MERWALVCLCLFLAGPASPALPVLDAQVATVDAEENFRAEPNGTVLARLFPGTLLTALEEDGQWIEADLEGWVWARSLQMTDRAGFDLVVSVPGGENLRVEPQGTRLGRLREGTLLEELERRPGWIRVRRAGWIWAPSVDVEPGVLAGGGVDGRVEPVPSDSAPSGPTTADEASPSERIGAPEGGMAVLASPDGDTLARVGGGTDLRVLAREGSWARVRLEGWAWLPGESGRAVGADALDGPVADAGPEDVAGSPDAYRGRTVTWRLQYISLERAEELRTDFYEGEPFLLTRPTGGGGPFVYVAVPPDRLEEVTGLTPLESLVVVGRVRIGASALTGSPILDLVELRRLGSGP